jgi:hypothetical protein
MAKQPWASGPSEILQHGLSLIHEDSDKNRRLALLSIDNAIELTIKTYLGLPRRITGISLGRKEFADISESFPRLLDALEEHAADKLDGIDLGEIEWFHRLRNQLYHQGNGLTVDRDKVDVYAELARLLFKNLFGFEVEVEQTRGHEILGGFLAAWVRLERAIHALGEKNKEHFSTLGGRVPPPLTAVRQLGKLNVLDSQTYQEIDEIRHIRNQVVHGTADYKQSLTREIVARVNAIALKLEELI